MDIAPKCITGPLATANKGAVHVGWQGLVAYGVEATVIVLQPETLEILQSLDTTGSDASPVVCLRWSAEPLSDALGDAPYYLKLAAANARGVITVWDVSNALPMLTLGHGEPLVDMAWLPANGLLVLESAGRFVAYAADSGAKLWTHGLPEAMVSFSVDPFDPNTLLLTSRSGWVYVAHGASTAAPPVSVTRKYRVSETGSSMAVSSGSPGSGSAAGPAAAGSSPLNSGSRIAKFSSFVSRKAASTMSMMGGTSSSSSSTPTSSAPSSLHRPTSSAPTRRDARPTSPPVPPSEGGGKLLDIIYMPTTPNVVAFILEYEIVFFDLSLEQPVSFLALERSRSAPFAYVALPRNDPGLMYTVTTDGSVVVRRAPPNSFHFDVLWSSSAVRKVSAAGGVLGHIYGIALAPMAPHRITLLTSSGAVANLSLSQGSRLACTGLLEPLARHASVLAVNSGRSAALGTSDGIVQLINLRAGEVDATLALFDTPVRGLAWRTSSSLLAWTHDGVASRARPGAFDAPSGTGDFDNSIVLVDTSTGQRSRLRTHVPSDGAPLVGVYVSSSGKYMAVALGSPIHVVEVWDIQSAPGECLRSIAGHGPVRAAAWSPLGLDLTTVSLGPHEATVVDASGSLVEALVIPDRWSSALLRFLVVDSVVHPGARISLLPPPNESGARAIPTSPSRGSSPSPSSSSPRPSSPALARSPPTLSPSLASSPPLARGSGTSSRGASPTPDTAQSRSSRSSDVITTLAWSGPTLMTGSMMGIVHVVDLVADAVYPPAVLRDPIVHAVCTPAGARTRLLVLFDGGGFGIWDVESRKALNHSSRHSGLRLLASALSWAGDTPVILGRDGMLRVIDSTLSRASAHISQRHPSDAALSAMSPLTLPHHVALCLKARIQHAWLSDSAPEAANEPVAPPHLSLVQCHLTRACETQASVAASRDTLSPELVSKIAAASSLAARALLAAQFFGDQDGADFWALIEHYLQKHLALARHDDSSDPEHHPADARAVSTLDPPVPEIPTAESTLPASDSERAALLARLHPLSQQHDLLQEREAVVARDSALLALHASQRGDYAYTQTKIHTHIQLAEYPAAVSALLDTPAEHPKYQEDVLMACLVSAVISPDQFVSTVKIVATDLVASGHVERGVQLLCLIGKRADACRYLQSFDMWREAAWLAKIGLPDTAAAVVLRSWARHLVQAGATESAVGVYISLMDWHSALQLLYNAKRYSRAALLARTCLDLGLVSPLSIPPDPTGSLLPLKPLLEAIFLEYGMFLYHIGAMALAEAYLLRAGHTGEHMLECLVQSQQHNASSAAKSRS